VKSFDEAFDDLNAQLCEEQNTAGPEQGVEGGDEILEAKIFDLTELTAIDKKNVVPGKSEDLYCPPLMMKELELELELE